MQGSGIPVVLLPSLGRDSYEFDEITEGLVREGLRVLRPQPRGIGASSGPMDGLTVRDLADDVAAAIEHVGDGPAVVAGHAFGHYIARTLASDRPELVRGVVVVAGGARRFPASLTELVAKCSDTALPDQERLGYLRTAFFAPGHDPSQWLEGWYPAVIRSQRAAMAASNKDEWWTVAPSPILDLQAAEDPFRPPETRNELVDEFGDLVTVAVIPDASHALIPEAPRQVVGEIAAWIRRLPNAG